MLKINNIFIGNRNELDEYFEKNSIDVDDTKELLNSILSYENWTKPKQEQVSQTDEEERAWISKKIEFAIEKIKNNPYTRQAVIYNLHNSGLDHNCLNIFHLYYREKKLSMNVYARSMNFKDNFEHDLYTFMLVLKKACDILEYEKGQVNVHIMSLHAFKK